MGRKAVNRAGQRFHNILIVEFSHSDPRGKMYWKCLCDCGKVWTARIDSITRGVTKSCGCTHKPRKDIYRESSKVCVKCSVEKSLDNFHKCSKNRDKHSYICKECAHLQALHYYAISDKEMKRQKSRLYYASSEKYKYKSRKRRLLKYNNGGKHSYSEFENLCSNFNGLCVRCFKKSKLTADHIVPLSRGGSDSIENIQPLCQSCNSYKSNKFVRDYRPIAQVITSYIRLKEVWNG